MKIAVCDDQIEFQNIILDYLDKLKRFDMDINTYNSGEELIEAVRNNRYYHIIFLDIQMKIMNGIETAEDIRKYDEKAMIIFITSHPDFALDGYNVSALHYLVKPVKFEQFEKVFNKAINSLEAKNKKITLNIGKKLISIDVSSILYIESHGREHLF